MLAVALLAAFGVAGEAAAATSTFTPVADSYVSSARPDANYGGSTILKVDGSPILRGYLRFDVRGLTDPVKSATLRLHSYSSTGTGVRVHPVASNAWGERAITHRNAPSLGAVAAASGPFSSGQSVALDVSELVTGDGLASFAITTTSSSSKSFSSREGARSPELVIETEPPPPPPPPPPPGDPVIAAAGDIACDPGDIDFKGGAGTATRCRQQHVSDLLVGRDLSAVLPLGDVQYEDGQLAKFQQSYDPSWGRFKAITRPAAGNHEYGTAGASGYFDYFNGIGTAGGPAGPRGEGYYSYDLQNWHLIALNSNCSAVGGCGPDSAQEQWLRADLAAHPSSCTLAYWHHPRFTSASRGGNTAVGALWDALYEAGADVVLNGHEHGYERFARQTPQGLPDRERGIREFVVGTGGKDLTGFAAVAPNSGLRQATAFGVLELTLGADGYDWRFVAEPGNGFSDSGSDGCEGSPPDTNAPSSPTGLRATASDQTTVQLAWSGSTDDDGVSEYRVLRDGQPVGTTTKTSYADAQLQPSTAYEYKVVALDPAGNASAPSAAASATTPGADEIMVEPSDDATIRSKYPDSTYGARTYLETDNSPVEHFLLKFPVSGVGDKPVRSATLRLHATNPSAAGGDLRVVDDATWSEQTVTWASAPPGAVTPVASLGAVAVGNWYEVDVTSLVSGDGPLNLRVTSTSSDGADYSSTEGAAGLAPQLRIKTG